MLKAIIGMIKWKGRMKKLAKQPAYTKSWWKECSDSLLFLPEEQREDFLNSYISTAIQM